MYRDKRTDGMMEIVFERVPKQEIFEQTGIQFMQINTLFQLASMVEAKSPLLEIARTFLTIPDLLNFWLTGAKVCEFTNATTTQMHNPRMGTWATPMLKTIGIPTDILPEVVQPGTCLGEYEGIPVIAPATHDTGSAVAGIPTQNPRFGYISSGTWSLVGLEVPAVIIGEDALEANATNEGGVEGTYRLLKNVMGLWIIQQCKATWAASGKDYTYPELVALAEAARSLQSRIDIDDMCFLAPGDHPTLVRNWCAEHGQPVPQTEGEIVRCVLESLALTYRAVLEKLQAISGQVVDVLHIIGGGTQNELLNQFAADATGIPVVTGPIEATVLGNAAVQLIALGELENIAQARQIIAEMGVTKVYEPQHTAQWTDAYHGQA
jgi:rhamnulokinase